jgi:hypothetical protein
MPATHRPVGYICQLGASKAWLTTEMAHSSRLRELHEAVWKGAG